MTMRVRLHRAEVILTTGKLCVGGSVDLDEGELLVQLAGDQPDAAHVADELDDDDDVGVAEVDSGQFAARF